MLYQAHRGVSTEYPENTMPAFQAAWEQGYPVIELDPAFTADGQCVVFHDKTVNRTCHRSDGSAIEENLSVSELTWQQLQTLDAGLFKGVQFRGTKVPLLSEVLDFAAQKNLLVKLDNKFQRFDTQQLDSFFGIVEASGAKVAFTCKDLTAIEQVIARFPNAAIHYDGPVDEPALAALKALLPHNELTVWLALPSELTAWVKVPMASAELCVLVKRHASLGLWILETREQLEEAERLGADIIETTGSLKPRRKP